MIDYGDIRPSASAGLGCAWAVLTVCGVEVLRLRVPGGIAEAAGAAFGAQDTLWALWGSLPSGVA